ncbi:MAG: hypothetical protein HY809_09180 [Nitrospirae bacterium]|nr:hypothetical protein [Nitrospirota bacterium]
MPILAGLFAVSCSGGPPVPFPAFDFVKEDVFTGEEISLESMRGQNVLIYFFASW